MDKPPKPTREEMDAANEALEAALRDSERGGAEAMDRVKLLQRVWEDVHKRFHEDDHA